MTPTGKLSALFGIIEELPIEYDHDRTVFVKYRLATV
jgi:hypothetical protein